MDDAAVLRAISVFGARARGVLAEDDTPELAEELRRRWDAEGHAPVRYAPDSVAGRVLRLARTGASRLPGPLRVRVRRGLELARRRRART